MAKTITNDLTEGSVLRQMLRFSIPFLLSNLLQTAYNMADMVIVGQAMGSAGLTAISIGGQVTTFLTIMGTNFASGGQVFIAQNVGLGDREKLGRAVGSLLTVILGLALALTAVGRFSYRGVLGLLNTPAESMEYACEYLRVCCYGLIFIYGYNAVCAALRGMGDSTYPLLFVALASLVNVALDLLFVKRWGMGPRGAAAATVISQGLAFFCSLAVLYLQRNRLGFSLRPSIFVPGGHETRVIFRLGIPLALMQVAIQCSMLYISTFINAYGLTASTVNAVGSKLYSVVTVVTTGMVGVCAVMIGQAIGAKKPERVNTILLWGLLFSGGSTVLFSAAAWLWPVGIFSLFDRDPAVLAMAGTYLRISSILYMGFGLMAPPLGLVNGVGHANLNMVISILDGVVARIALSLLLGRTMGLNGFFLGNAIASWVSVILCGWYWISGRWRRRAALTDE